MNLSLLKIVGLFLIFLILIGLTSFSVLKDTTSGGGLNKAEVGKIVQEFIENNPQVILESVARYQQQAAQEATRAAQASIKDKTNELENDPDSPIAGNPNGDVTIVEFFDYSCGYCKKVIPTLVQLLEEDKNVKIVFKELPILGPGSVLAAKASLGVHIIAPDKYFEFHKLLMSGPRIRSQSDIDKLAGNIGLDPAKLKEAMDSQKVEEILTKDKILASSVGVHGTPAFVIAGELVPGAIDISSFKALVKKARETKK